MKACTMSRGTYANGHGPPGYQAVASASSAHLTWALLRYQHHTEERWVQPRLGMRLLNWPTFSTPCSRPLSMAWLGNSSPQVKGRKSHKSHKSHKNHERHKPNRLRPLGHKSHKPNRLRQWGSALPLTLCRHASRHARRASLPAARVHLSEGFKGGRRSRFNLNLVAPPRRLARVLSKVREGLSYNLRNRR